MEHENGYPIEDAPVIVSRVALSVLCSYIVLIDSVFLVIPVHNRKNTTLGCLNRLRQLHVLEKSSVVVIDDGSTDGTSEIIEETYPSVTLLKGDGNLWWTGAVKVGMQYAYANNGDFVIWLNDDCLVGEGTIEGLVAFASDNPNTIVGGIGYESTNTAKLSFGGKLKRRFGYKTIELVRNDIYLCDLLSGNLVCMPVSVIENIGYPDVEKYPHYGGDSHFLIRARKAGYSIFADARHPARNMETFSTSKMNSNRWLLGDTSVKQLFQLIFTQHSVLSWRVWWFMYTEDYGLTGKFLFLAKYIKMIAILLCISVLRLFPISVRKRISYTKRQLLGRKI